jgi:glycosyltransferase involved in cell wall biosynthesis
MTLVIITHVPHIVEGNQHYAYAPYVREMNIWNKYADKVIVVAPQEDVAKTAIHIAYNHSNIEFVAIENFNIVTYKAAFLALLKIPKIMQQIFSAMQRGNHIHLRCPGNIGFLGTLMQLFFPGKSKTAKYAGNWDPKEKVPWSYKLQKKILNNTFFTRNIQVLVYGKWEGSSKNVKSFFTATYTEKDKKEVSVRVLQNEIRILFVGTLSSGKKPLYAIKLIEALIGNDFSVKLSLYGEGLERQILEQYIQEHKLTNDIQLFGNQNLEAIKEAYQQSHFVILPSESEGWPKVIAEAMFWGCVPIATTISCVPYMLDYGKRGLLLNLDLNLDVHLIKSLIENESEYQQMVIDSVNWSRKYTLDVFEAEIKLLLQQ